MVKGAKMYRIKLSNVLIMVTCILLIGPPAMAGERFTDNGDDTVTDHQLGLMWAKTDNHGDINWKQANQWVKYTFGDTLAKGMITGGCRPWRNFKASM